MNGLAQPMRRNRLLRIAKLLADHERATPLARRVLECRLSLVEAELTPGPEDAPAIVEESELPGGRLLSTPQRTVVHRG